MLHLLNKLGSLYLTLMWNVNCGLGQAVINADKLGLTGEQKDGGVINWRVNFTYIEPNEHTLLSSLPAYLLLSHPITPPHPFPVFWWDSWLLSHTSDSMSMKCQIYLYSLKNHLNIFVIRMFGPVHNCGFGQSSTKKFRQ